MFKQNDSIKDFKQAYRLRKQAEMYFLRAFNLPSHPDDLPDVDADNYSVFGGCNTLTNACDEMHASVDSQNPSNVEGRPIYPVAYGTIVFEGAIASFGNYLVVEHDVYGEKFYSVYAHLQVNDLQSVGTVVDNNIQIGKMGNTNQANGTHQGGMSVHLHFEVRKTTNVNSSYGVSGKIWWPTNLDEMHANFVDLSSIFGKGQAFDTLP
jgi:murein DD-endopeptidase MepM/ murein hydrolase activator NlpD